MHNLLIYDTYDKYIYICTYININIYAYFNGFKLITEVKLKNRNNFDEKHAPIICPKYLEMEVP